MNGSWLIPMLLFAVLIPAFTPAPVKADDPAPTATCAQQSVSTNNINCNLAPLAGGNFITMQGEIKINTAGCGASITITAFSVTWTQDIVDCWNAFGVVYLYTFIAHTQSAIYTGNSCAFSDSATNGQNSEIAVECMAFPAQSPLNVQTQSDSGGSSGGMLCSAATTCTDTVSTLDQYTIQIISNIAILQGGALTMGHATGFTAVNPGSACVGDGSGFCGQSQYNGNPAGTTTGATTSTQTSADMYMKETAAGFGVCTGCGLTAVIGPCNFFELQCWWYPLLFMGLYSGFILMVGTWLRTSPRGKAHLFLSAVTFGSLIAVILGIMNIVFPLAMLVLNTIIALRLRG